MKVSPINEPLDGERILATHPAIETFPERDWRRRINHYTGRTLTHTALDMEQTGRGGRLTTLGQLVTPGVVAGLEAELSIATADGEDRSALTVTAGHAVSPAGEIARISRELTVPLADLRTFWLTAVDEAIDRGDALSPELLPVPGSGVLAPRKVGATLGELGQREAPLPAAAVLLLQPIVAEVIEDPDRRDPCELDPDNYAFENWQRIDGSRLLLYFWPEEWQLLPARDAQWRNRLAYTVFARERELAPPARLPWEHVGIPLGLLAFDEAQRPLFIDRAAVVRAGGMPKARTGPVTGAGNAALWRARFEQFNEHLAAIVGSVADDDPLAAAALAFRHVPPVGVLPKDFIDARRGSHEFFPVTYDVDAAAVPMEQLEALVAASRSFASFDTFTPDRVQVLVPVPQVAYEPRLLEIETISPEFDATLRDFIRERNRWLGRRFDVRRKASAIFRGINGRPLAFPDPDPGAVDELEIASPFDTALVEVEDEWRFFRGSEAPPDDWAAPDFDAGDWERGPTALGYGLAAVSTELDDMRGAYSSVFARRTFALAAGETAGRFRFSVHTTGGLFVFLNGSQVVSHNVSSDAVDGLAEARGDLARVEFEIDDAGELLQEGDNVLAILAQTHDIGSSAFLVSPRLLRSVPVADAGEDAYGTAVAADPETGVPVLDDSGEPVYSLDEVDSLREHLDTQTPLSEAEVAKLDELGVEDYVDFLQRKVDRANDKIDIGFVRVQTDIYRIRQLVLGNVEGTRLATSPALAAIAMGETAVATKEQLSDYVRSIALGEGPSDGGTPRAAPTAPPGAGAASVGRAVRGDTFISGELLGDLAGGGGARVGGGTTTIGGGGGFPGIGIATGGGIGTAIGGRPGTVVGGGTGPVLGGGSGSAVGGGTRLGVPDSVNLTAGSGTLFGDRGAVVDDIQEQGHIVGGFHEFRNVTVGERLKDPLANEAKAAGVASKAEVLSAFVTEADDDLAINVNGLLVPGFRDADGETTLDFGNVGAAEIDEVLTNVHDANPDGAEDEAAFFNAGIRATENAVATLRLVEGRVKSYKRAIARCRQALEKLREARAATDARLRFLGDELAEARHDVSVARALRAEEQARIDAINERRDAVLRDHVPFLVFHRPRLSEARLDVPVRNVDPDLSELPLPRCGADADEAPQEIDALMDVLKDAPLKWFRFGGGIFRYLDRLRDIRITAKQAKARSRLSPARHPFFDTDIVLADRFAKSIGSALFKARDTVLAERRKTADFNLAAMDRLGWKESAARVREVVSLGDVIDGHHGRAIASRAASRELDRIARTATCLYLHFGEVLPSLRLDWAERLSQFDAPVNLRNLHNLPRFGDIDVVERHELQALVDWLYQRVDEAQNDAVALISDLVRVCILLASHAPVRRIIAGRLSKPAVVGVGGRVNIVIDLSKIRIGMAVVMQTGGKAVARGVIDDIAGGEASARIVETAGKTVSLGPEDTVQVGETRALGGAGPGARLLIQAR